LIELEYILVWTDKSRKNLEKLPKEIAGRVIESVESLRKDPFLHIDRLAGSRYYKYRIGKYRVILDVRRNLLIIFVIKIGHRREVYRDF
jgi:mRNA interferase RelE/StbE